MCHDRAGSSTLKLITFSFIVTMTMNTKMNQVFCLVYYYNVLKFNVIQPILLKWLYAINKYKGIKSTDSRIKLPYSAPLHILARSSQASYLLLVLVQSNCSVGNIYNNVRQLLKNLRQCLTHKHLINSFLQYILYLGV